MKPLQASEIRGNWATLLLPILPDESIDFELLEAEIDHFARVGVNGIYSNGSAGEFYTQTEAEFDRINDLLARKCEGYRIPFQIGANHTSPQVSLGRIKRTQAPRRHLRERHRLDTVHGHGRSALQKRSKGTTNHDTWRALRRR